MVKKTSGVRLSLTKNQAILLTFLVSSFMLKKGVGEVAIGKDEIDDLVNKLTNVLKKWK